MLYTMEKEIYFLNQRGTHNETSTGGAAGDALTLLLDVKTDSVWLINLEDRLYVLP